MKPTYAVLPDFAIAQKLFVVREIVRPVFSTDFHFHQECQLVYVLSGTGRRIIGSSIEQFKEGDMTFIGPNVPHVWYSDQASGNEPRPARSVALYIHPEVVLRQLSGLTDVQPLTEFFRKSERGLSLTGLSRDALATILLRMQTETGLALLSSFLEIMQRLLVTPDARWLNDELPVAPYADSVQQRIPRLMEYIRTNFRQDISLETAASVAGLQLHSFCRYFKALTQRTFSDFINEVRVGFACQLLQQSDLPVTQVAYECGYTNISYFNRSFQRIQGFTPRAYRLHWQRAMGSGE